jgi:hypothetical protein
MSKQIGWLLITVMTLAASIAAAAASEPSAQRHFPTPEAAIEALVAGNRDNNQAELLAIFGASGARLIRSGDPVEDERGRSGFVAAFDEAHRIQLEGQGQAVLIVGKSEWPLPIPVIHDAAGWRFDTQAGEQEILNRRIGRNELKVIQVCRAYVSAQREYAALQLGGQSEFALRFVSSGTQRDGLYWSVKPGDPESPFGPLVAQAQASGYAAGEAAPAHSAARPYYGYFFHILTSQGPNAAGGAKSYLVDGRMTRGFALVAYPAKYGDSGVMSFLVNDHGIVFEKNLGHDTGRVARRITQYDPDPSWHIAAQ